MKPGLQFYHWLHNTKLHHQSKMLITQHCSSGGLLCSLECPPGFAPTLHSVSAQEHQNIESHPITINLSPSHYSPKPDKIQVTACSLSSPWTRDPSLFSCRSSLNIAVLSRREWEPGKAKKIIAVFYLFYWHLIQPQKYTSVILYKFKKFHFAPSTKFLD